jgi:hypothetical protein
VKRGFSGIHFFNQLGGRLNGRRVFQPLDHLSQMAYSPI